MTQPDHNFIVAPDDLIVITGATGFIGSRVVRSLLGLGFRNLRCFARHTADSAPFHAEAAAYEGAQVEVFQGNLLSSRDCETATQGAAVIFHLAAGRGEKSFPEAFMNSVVTTRNLLEACVRHRALKRFVNVSSFAVYSNCHKSRAGLLDESCPLELRPDLRGDAYAFAKLKQDEIVAEYNQRFALPYVIVRPGSVYGPGNEAITARVGIGTFGLFLHMGGGNRIPFTYVDNCAEAIVLAGLQAGIDGETFNIVDDEPPTSREFLRLYKKNVRRFKSLYVPHAISYALCFLWERYSAWSEGQLPPAFNRRRWHAFWKSTRYSNDKLKTLVGWTPAVLPAEGFRRYFESCRKLNQHA
jgi:nucleoside-diphosphate-sugar epimerase